MLKSIELIYVGHPVLARLSSLVVGILLLVHRLFVCASYTQDVNSSEYQWTPISE
jgi:hypothetical protein